MGKCFKQERAERRKRTPTVTRNTVTQVTHTHVTLVTQVGPPAQTEPSHYNNERLNIIIIRMVK